MTLQTQKLEASDVGACKIEARAVAIVNRETAFGNRIYAVFQTTDGTKVGIWRSADRSPLGSLELGDRVFLTRDSGGHLHLPSQGKGLRAFGRWGAAKLFGWLRK